MGIKVMEKRNDSITHEEEAIPIKRIGCIGMARNESKEAKVVSALKSTGHPISPTVSSTACFLIP